MGLALAGECGLAVDVEDPGGAATATITARLLQRTNAGWVENEITLVAHDGGKGRSVDSVSCDACSPAIDGTFVGQITVHSKRS